MVLKHYLQLSDEMLIERINTDWSMQRFCGISLKPNEVIKDKGLPSFWRIYIGKHLNIEELKIVSAKHWSPYMEHKNISSADATCYESHLSFPKLLKKKVFLVPWDTYAQLKIFYTFFVKNSCF
ncbi:MAG: transposase [Ferruginibacter sp.]|nr:transposase [Ferruginibacter sp.]